MPSSSIGTAYAAIVPKFDKASLGSAMTGAAKTVEGKLAGAAKSFPGKLGGAISSAGSAIGGALKTTLAAGAAAGGAALGASLKSAFDDYASYEQLTGGVETLFKKSANAVKKYADEAYKTAGMDANSYMDTVTSFSASMITSLGGDTKKAAKLSNQAIVDMSDNANKMGTNMQDIQNAYQGFAKQNYTMLDNLKLGYGGTQSEMKRLLSDAEKLTGKKYDLSSFADITEAIHAVQTEMGITGTTSKEAATTIEGSINSMKASWTNWLTELGKDNADMEGATKELVESIGTALDNIIPRIITIAENLKTELGKRLPEIWESIQEWAAGIDLGQMLTDAVTKIQEFVSSIDWGELLSSAIDGIFDAVIGVMDSISELLEGSDDGILEAELGVITKVVEAIIRNVPRFLAAGARLVMALVTAIGRNAANVASKFGQTVMAGVNAVKEKASSFASAGLDLVRGIVNGIGDGASWVRSKITEVCSNALDALKSFFGIHSPSTVMAKMGGYMMQGWADGISGSKAKAVNSVKAASRDVLRAAAKGGTIALTAGLGMTPATAAAGNTYVVNGVTYDDGSNVAEAVGDLVRGLRIRRRS